MLDRLEVSGSWVSGCFAICFSSFDGTITYPCSLTFYCSIESNLPMVVVAFCIRSNVFPRFSACCFSNITFLLNDRSLHEYLQEYFIWNETSLHFKYIHSLGIAKKIKRPLKSLFARILKNVPTNSHSLLYGVLRQSNPLSARAQFSVDNTFMSISDAFSSMWIFTRVKTFSSTLSLG